MTADQPRRGPGRRAGESRTREAILAAARRRFAEQGYDGATIRGIAADAGVNPALVHHFYGTKERLFAAAMRLPAVPSEVLVLMLGAERDQLGGDFAAHLGEALIGALLRAWDILDVRAAFLAMIRSAATGEQGATMLREFVTSTILATLSQVAGLGDDAEGRYRVTLVASQVIGLGFARYVLGLEPLASSSAADLVAAIGPTVQRYLTGDIGRLSAGRADSAGPQAPAPTPLPSRQTRVGCQHAALGWFRRRCAAVRQRQIRPAGPGRQGACCSQ